jgi:hypothetical protein
VDAPENRRLIIERIALSIRAAETAKRMIADIAPDLAVFYDGVYTPEGEFVDTCIKGGIDTVFWARAHRSDRLIFKRYTSANREEHPKSLSAATWAKARSMSWTQAHRARIERELYESYASGDWQSHVRTQRNKQLMPPEELRRMLGLNPGKKTAVIFPHILWDASLSWGRDLFANYEEWLIETARGACANPDVNWVVKVHPAHVMKSMLNRFDGEPIEVAVLRKRCVCCCLSIRSAHSRSSG